ncbi:glycosyltransferase family 1 protein [Candidatus Acetothermia bacterium]|nr:glycosyltransferase family 1 protein [Candidatus Acetothermia bacterium]
MKITIITLGSTGDVYPYVGLGLGLQASGHSVRLATNARFEKFILQRGLGFSPMGDDRQSVTAPGTGGSSLSFLRQCVEFGKTKMRQLFIDGQKACQDADAIIYSTTGYFIGYHIAEMRGIPFYGAFLQPIDSTGAFASAFFPEFPSWLKVGRASYNRLTHFLTTQVPWQLLRPSINQYRQEIFDLPPLSFPGPFQRIHQEHRPVLYGYSPAILPKPFDWGNWIHVTGYWQLVRESGWTPPNKLVDFLNSGRKPVYVGFGSTTTSNPEEITELVLNALTKAKQRGILLTGWGGLSQADSSDDVLVVDAVPHDWLFPQMAAVVHHGGAGTMAAGLRAGIPTVTIPFFADQFFWGRRVYELGVGPLPIPRKQLSVDRLANAMRAAIIDTEMRSRAMALGQRLRAEDGVAEAVRAFHKHLGEDWSTSFCRQFAVSSGI